MTAVAFFLTFLKASLLSTGGLGNLPSLQQDLTAQHVANPSDFAAALAIGQVAPGPTGLWVVSLGYLVAGWAGAALALVAAAIPPLLVVPVDRFRRHVGEVAAAADFIQGIGLAFVAVLPLVLLKLVLPHGFEPRAVALAAAAAALAATRRVPPIAIIGACAAAGIALYR